LNQISEMSKFFDVPVGFSDHSGEIHFPISALALGASVVEVHVVFDKKMFGPDTPASITMDGLSQLKLACDEISKALQNPLQKGGAQNDNMARIFGRSLALRKPLKKGQIIDYLDLECKKPAGMGVSSEDYNSLIGKSLNADFSVGQFIKHGDIKI
jgi:N,N'-diacetyllegionaminate synthase